MQQNQVKIIADTIAKLHTEKELEDFLLGILTESEIDELNKRFEVIKLLKVGKSHREIAKQLKVGIATVTRGSKELQKGRFKYV